METSETLSLPRVGTTRLEVPSTVNYKEEKDVPVPCVVIHANLPHLWYMVRFDSGVRECYKVPKIKHMSETELNVRQRPGRVKNKPRRKK